MVKSTILIKTPFLSQRKEKNAINDKKKALYLQFALLT